MRPIIIAALAGLALTLAFPPVGAAWLAVPAVALFLWCARRRGWWVGLAFGLGFFGTLFPWLAELGLVAFLPLLLLQAAFLGVFGGLLYRARTWPDWVWWVAAVGGWGLMEFTRERYPLGGFAWGMLGYPVGAYALTRNATGWIGTSGWSIVIVMVAAGLVLVAERRSWRPLLAAVGVILLLAAAGLATQPGPEGPEVLVAVVQGNEPCLGYHCPGERRQIFESHLALTTGLEEADLVVWAEGSTGFDADPVLDPAVGAAIGAQARRLGAWFLVGGDRPIDDATWVNANVIFSPEGEIVDEYQKRHPVPFGEYIPARSLFDWIPALAAVPRDMIRGEEPKVFDMGFGRVGSVISFEGSFARYTRQTVGSGAQLLVVATSQASYPRSNASDQFLAMTRMRAAELGVDVIHVAVTGRSAIFTGGGEFAGVSPLAEPATLVAPVRIRTAGPTLYTRWGEWVQGVAVLAMFGTVLARRRAGEA